MAKHYVNWYELEGKKFPLPTGEGHWIYVKRESLPIVFVPGIMGSRLRQRRGGRVVWDPPNPNNTTQSIGAAARWATRSAATRKRLLIGDRFDENFLEVDPSTAREMGNQGVAANFTQIAVDRGWGGVYWSSYGALLQWLETEAWAGDTLTRYFRFPTYAVGYNWTASNEASGQRLKQRISDIIAENNREDTFCERVLIVSHSMGGLASRAAMLLAGAASQVVGAIHAVQPVTGSPAAYKRMKAGFEGTSQIILGRNARDVTAILGNAPGGLQLLPTPQYRTNSGSRPWLHVGSSNGYVAQLPVHDPYDEIYQERDAFWRLVDEALLDPDSRLPAHTSAWTEYLRHLDNARGFHRRLGLDKHPKTYTVHGIGTAHAVWDHLAWELSEASTFISTGFGGGTQTKVDGGPATAGSIAAIQSGQGVAHVSNHNGTIELKLPQHAPTSSFGSTSIPYIEAKIKPPTGEGDGTVPASSGRALTGVERTGTAMDIEHEPVFGDAGVRQFLQAALQRLAKTWFDARIAP